jgi:hypothetical protein
MAWSAPMTAVANSTFTAAQFNQYVRDNLNETAPAKATAAGGHFVSTGVNSIAERHTDGTTDLNDGETTSTTFDDLDSPAAVGPSVTVDTGPSALVIVHCQLSNSGAGSSRMAYDVSGATTISAADNRGTGIFGSAGVTLIASGVALHFGGLALNPGSNTFTAKYRVSSGTGTFTQRRIAVFPL